MNKTGLHFENSNLEEYDIDRDKHADEKNSCKGKCVCTVDNLLAVEMSDNAHKYTHRSHFK